VANRGYPCSPGCACGRHSRSLNHRETGEKLCPKCKLPKPLDDFDIHHVGKNGLVYHARCKSCRTDDMRLTMRQRAVARYGITLEQYEKMLADQGNACAVCGEPESDIQNGKLRPLCVDHDHATGKIRGLLCNDCNRGLGFLGDNADRLEKAAYYLRAGE
jgi:hypothetical protein